MNPQEKENLYEVILAETEDQFGTHGSIWEMYADAVIGYIDNNIVEIITGEYTYRIILMAALEAFTNSPSAFNQNWLDTLVAA